jgi:hypothetical protein
MITTWYTLKRDHFTVRSFASLVSLSSKTCTVSVLVDKSLIPLNHSPESVMHLLDLSATKNTLTIQLQQATDLLQLTKDEQLSHLTKGRKK